MSEVWKDIAGYDDYEVSNLGRIRDRKTLILVPQYNSRRYKTVNLRSESKTNILAIHRIVAVAFIPNPKEYPVVNHIDGCKSNNAAFNLEWVTYKENTSHAYAKGLIKREKKVKDDSWKEKLIYICGQDKRSKSQELEWLVEKRYEELKGEKK